MTKKELIEKLASKLAWRFVLTIYARIVVGCAIAYLILLAISAL